MKLALAQINATVGGIPGNEGRVRPAYHLRRAQYRRRAQKQIYQ
jgi:hypothetical protein